MIYNEYVQRKGYGLHHLGIRTTNMQKSIKNFQSKGFKVIQSGKRPGTSWAYIDSEKKTGIIFELIEHATRCNRR